MNNLKKSFLLNKISSFLEKNFKIIKILFTISLLLLIFSTVDLVEALKNFTKINYLIIFPLSLYLPGLLISTIKWKYALGTKKTHFELFKIYWISNFFSNFLPSNIGGDSYKILKLKSEINSKTILKSVVFDRLTGLIALILISSILSFIVYNLTQNIFVIIIPLLALLSLFGLFLISSKLKSKYLLILRKTLNEFKSKFINLLLLSFLFDLLCALSLWCYYLMYGYNINFLVILGFFSTIQLINILPISINALGIREGLMIYFFSFVGVPFEVSLSLAILSRIISVIQSSIGGLIFIFWK